MMQKTLVLLMALTCVGATCFAEHLEFNPRENMVKCKNGYFVGDREKATGVLSFKGIPYAQQPVGALRWQPPQPVKDSNQVYLAQNFGVMPLQNATEDAPEIRDLPTGEKCLNLNVWTADLTGKKKPVMFYFHGGAYGWEGAALPDYDMQYLAQANPDMVFVTMDYRVNSLGFLDLSKVPDGKVYKAKDFKKAPYLGILDCIQSLKWAKENIAAFGGDPDNITIFGESAGGGITSILLTAKESQGLFKRAIVQSGSLNLTFNQDAFDRNNQTEELMKVTGARNMDDLMGLSPDEIRHAWSQPTEKVGVEGFSLVENLQNFPLRGKKGILPDQPLDVVRKGASKNVDVIIGTTKDEWRYWINSSPGNTDAEKIDRYDKITKNRVDYFLTKFTAEQKDLFVEYYNYLSDFSDKYTRKYPLIWKNTEVINDLAFRIPALNFAEARLRAKGKGKTYVYYFAREAVNNDYLGACHAAELYYVFHNTHMNVEINGREDGELVDKFSRLWTNFARNGEPTSDEFVWLPYDSDTKQTFVFGADGSMNMVANHMAEQTKLIRNFAPTDINF